MPYKKLDALNKDLQLLNVVILNMKYTGLVNPSRDNILKRQHGVGFVVKVDPNVELVQVEYLDARNVVTSQGIRVPTQSDKLLCTN